MNRIVILAILMMASISLSAQYTILPTPVKIAYGKGEVMLGSNSEITLNHDSLKSLEEYLRSYLYTDPMIAIFAPKGLSGISLMLDEKMALAREGYRLTVSESGVEIRGKDYGGVFNGIQTLLQMLPLEVYRKGYKAYNINKLPFVTIEDYPHYSYRGFMLDVARTFVPVEDVKKVIDRMAYHKLNKLHWHLTDDEAWRIEIKAYPELATKGGFRGGDSPIKPIYGAWDKKYGGYYTREQIKDIVSYAATRNIEVIPEIDLPGHSRAAGAVYKDILCNYPAQLSAGYDRRNVWCPSKKSNYVMLTTIIDELIELFPSQQIHIGGDEVSYSQWLSCPDCKRVMATKGMGKPKELFDLFIDSVSNIVYSKGRNPAVWDEAAESKKMNKKNTVYAWQKVSAAADAMKSGYPTILCAGEYFYCDMKQNTYEAGLTWAGLVNTEKLYSLDLNEWKITSSQRGNLLGVQCTLFSEVMLSAGLEYLDYKLFPRLCALSEIGWNADNRPSWSDFYTKMRSSHLERLDAMEIRYGAIDDEQPASEHTARIKANRTTTVKIPLDQVATTDTTWMVRLRTIAPMLKIEKIAREHNGKLSTLVGYSHSINQFTERKIAVNSTNRSDSLVYVISNKSPKDATLRFEFNPISHLEPKVTITSSMGEQKKFPMKSAADYNFSTQARTSRTCRKGDYIIYTFDRPLRAKSILVATGLNYLERYMIYDADVFTSHNGTDYQLVSNLKTGSGRTTIYPNAPIKSIKIVSGQTGNGETSVAIQDLLIR